LDEISNFLCKFLLNFYFLFQFLFSISISIFNPNLNFWSKFRFLTKRWIIVENFELVNPDSFFTKIVTKISTLEKHSVFQINYLRRVEYINHFVIRFLGVLRSKVTKFTTNFGNETHGWCHLNRIIFLEFFVVFLHGQNGNYLASRPSQGPGLVPQ